MNHAAATAAIKARLAAQWTTTAIAYANEPFAKPTATVSGVAAPAPFVLLEVEWLDGEQMSIGAPGANLVRRRGEILLHVLVPEGTGTATAETHAGTLAGIFECQTFSGVRCHAAQPGVADARAEDGSYFGRSIAVPFEYDETA